MGDPFLLDREDHTVDERHRPAAIVEQAGLTITGLGLARVRLAAEVRVAFQHVAAVFLVHRHHERAGADRPSVQRQVLLRHAGLGVELVGLPGHRREERHHHPVQQLRVLALHAHAQRVLVERDRAGHLVLAKVQERQVAPGRRQVAAQLPVDFGDALAVLLQPDDVLAHQRVRGALDARGRQPPDRIHVVVRGQFARAGVHEVGDREFACGIGARQGVVARPARRVAGKCRMRREQDARFQLDVVHAFCDRRPRRVGRQLAAGGVEVARLRDRHRRARRQLVWPLQVVEAEQRLVDVEGERRLVVRIRRRRVEVTRRALLETGEQRVAALGATGMRAVDDAAAGAEHAGDGDQTRRANAGAQDDPPLPPVTIARGGQRFYAPVAA